MSDKEMTRPERLSAEQIEQAADELRWYAKHLDHFHERSIEEWREQFNREINELRDLALHSLAVEQNVAPARVADGVAAIPSADEVTAKEQSGAAPVAQNANERWNEKTW